MQLYGLARSLLTDPLFWVVVMLAVGVLLGTRRPAAGRRWVMSGLVILVLLGWRLPSNAVMHQLESWHPPADKDPSAYAGVVVLGGSFESALLQGKRGQVQLNAHADRLTEAVALAKEHPSLPIIFTGGCVDTGEGCVAEAELARRFFTHMGLAPERVQYESASRTTFENAVLTAQLPDVDKTQPWLLLT